MYKKEFGIENYFSKLATYEAIVFCKFRTTNHNLPIERGRFQNIVREERICNLCNKDLGDEYHTLLVCETLNNLRKQYIKPYYYTRSNVIKFNQLMNINKLKELHNLIHFIRKINKMFII